MYAYQSAKVLDMVTTTVYLTWSKQKSILGEMWIQHWNNLCQNWTSLWVCLNDQVLNILVSLYTFLYIHHLVYQSPRIGGKDAESRDEDAEVVSWSDTERWTSLGEDGNGGNWKGNWKGNWGKLD